MINLLDLTSTPRRFFDILPQDWRIEIEPYWSNYKNNSFVYGLVENDQVVAGGIVFTIVSPDTRGYFDVAQKWLDQGYRYIGFIYVDENRRNEGMGSLWLKKVKELNPNQKYWLAIDEYGLARFYMKHGFSVIQEVQNKEATEWILVE